MTRLERSFPEGLSYGIPFDTTKAVEASIAEVYETLFIAVVLVFRVNRLAFLAGVHAKLKPGGVLGIIDHAGIASQDNKKLHRIEKQRVLDTIAKTPFELEAESDLLANEGDDHTKMVFAPELRGNTDRFLLRLRKPAA